MIPFGMFAQGTKKEVHIKIVENGVVTKDTVYNITGDLSETEHFAMMEADHAKMAGSHKRETQVFIMSDSAMKDIDWVQEGGKHKEVKVIVKGGEDEDELSEVEEIWIGGSEEGKPCRTIIIHEGNCPGDHMKMDRLMAPKPPKKGERTVKVEKKVIKTGEGEKVIIIETTEDDQPGTKAKRNK